MDYNDLLFPVNPLHMSEHFKSGGVTDGTTANESWYLER